MNNQRAKDRPIPDVLLQVIKDHPGFEFDGVLGQAKLIRTDINDRLLRQGLGDLLEAREIKTRVGESGGLEYYKGSANRFNNVLKTMLNTPPVPRKKKAAPKKAPKRRKTAAKEAKPPPQTPAPDPSPGLDTTPEREAAIAHGLLPTQAGRDAVDMLEDSPASLLRIACRKLAEVTRALQALGVPGEIAEDPEAVVATLEGLAMILIDPPATHVRAAAEFVRKWAESR